MEEEVMFKEERQAEILKIVERDGRIGTALIQRKFSVGYGTARNDLDELAEKGLLKRTHAGAVSIRTEGVGQSAGIHGLSAKERCEEVKENYRRIAEEAVRRIREDEVVFLTSASMGYLCASAIPDGLRCTVVTNSSSVAEVLRKKPGVRVFLTGGEMEENGNFYDDFTLSVLKQFRFDRAYLTAAGLSAEFGMSAQGSGSVGVYRHVIARSREVCALFPAEKIGAEYMRQLCEAEEIDVLITEESASSTELTALEEKGVKIVRV
jgi:DeoR/GlpR family transcriptional regulator of sugar metabolism